MAKRLNWFEYLYERIGIATGFVILAMTLLITASVFLRYVVRSPIEWSIEISEYMLLLSVLPAAGYVTLIDGHIRVDLLVGRLPPRVQRFLSKIVTILVLLYGLVLLWQTTKYTYRAYVMDWHSMSQQGYYLLPIIIWMPIAVFLLCLAYLFRLFRPLGR